MSTLKVSLVSAARTLWEGEATQVIARTTEGLIGILRGHAPMLALLAEGEVRILGGEGGDYTAEVSGGFLSIANDMVTVVAEKATVGAGTQN